MSTLICLTLTAPTIGQDLEILDRYREFVDIAELRADFLDTSEYPHIRAFPEKAQLPCILTVRRESDGGRFEGGEGSRTVLFARGLAFADPDPRRNFSYVDLEEDFQISSIEEVARAFGIKVVRSMHNMTGAETNLAARLKGMMRSGDEIAKIAFMPQSLADVTALFREAKDLQGEEFTLIAMGPLGLPTRVLAPVIGSSIAYCSIPADDPTLYPAGAAEGAGTGALGQIDPVTLCNVYNFRSINPSTQIYGIAGYPLGATLSPAIHNAGFKAHGKDAVYIPIRAKRVSDVMDFAAVMRVKGLSVTHPFKQSVMTFVDKVSPEAEEIGAVNTVVRRGGEWHGFNSDISGFTRAILEFLGRRDLRRVNTAIIGAGGAARAIALAVRRLKGRACIFNRTEEKAKLLAQEHGFKWAPLDRGSVQLLSRYSDLIIQTTSAGMLPNMDEDPIFFYNFSGHEAVCDIIYAPPKTKMLRRAEAAGCKTCNGLAMLQYQAYDQFELFTGEAY